MGTYESAHCVTSIGTDVYLGTVWTESGGSGAGRLLHYNQSAGTWEELGSFTGGSYTSSQGVYALSAAEQSGGTRYLFVGGNFTNVTYGTNSSAGSNVVALNITGTSRSISKLGTSTVYGTSDFVFSLKALPWLEPYGQYLSPGMRCLVGGKFTTAGSVASKGIALWSQGLSSGWSGFSGGFNGDGYGDVPKVYGIEAMTGSGSSGDTAFNGIWLTGAFQRISGGITNMHAVKLSGSTGSTWVNLGKLYGRLNSDGTDVEPYGSFYGTSIALISSTVYFGGMCTYHRNSSGTILGDGLSDLSFVSLPTSSSLITAYTSIVQINAMAKKGAICTLLAFCGTIKTTAISHGMENIRAQLGQS